MPNPGFRPVSLRTFPRSRQSQRELCVPPPPAPSSSFSLFPPRSPSPVCSPSQGCSFVPSSVIPLLAPASLSPRPCVCPPSLLFSLFLLLCPLLGRPLPFLARILPLCIPPLSSCLHPCLHVLFFSLVIFPSFSACTAPRVLRAPLCSILAFRPGSLDLPARSPLSWKGTLSALLAPFPCSSFFFPFSPPVADEGAHLLLTSDHSLYRCLGSRLSPD
jgi:hypothetical protein